MVATSACMHAQSELCLPQLKHVCNWIVVLIDWVTAVVDCRHKPLNGGLTLVISPDGEEESRWIKPTKVRSSYETNIHVRSEGADGQGMATHLRIDGNPSKFLQGHNVFGSDLLIDLLSSCISYLPVKLSVDELLKVRRGQFQLYRVDINYAFDLGSNDNVLSWIRAAESTTKTRHGRPASKGGTLYWGKNSRRHSFKAYSKFDEMQTKTGRLNSCVPHQKKLLDFADGKLRLELTLRRMELEKLGMTHGTAWKDENTPRRVYNAYLERLEVAKNCTMTDDKVLKLPRAVQGTYLLWEQGIAVVDRLSKATYYRHRKLLLEHGIDISMPCANAGKSNVIPLLRPLEAKPVEVPQWAYETNMVYRANNVNLNRAVGDDFSPVTTDQILTVVGHAEDVGHRSTISNSVELGRQSMGANVCPLNVVRLQRKPS